MLNFSSSLNFDFKKLSHEPLLFKKKIAHILSLKQTPKVSIAHKIGNLFFSTAYAEPITIAVVGIVLTIGISLLDSLYSLLLRQFLFL